MQEVLQYVGASLGGTMPLEVTLLKVAQTGFLNLLPEPNPPQELLTTDLEEAFLQLEFSDRTIPAQFRQTPAFPLPVEPKHSADPQETERCAVVQQGTKGTRTPAAQLTRAHSHLVAPMLSVRGMVESL